MNSKAAPHKHYHCLLFSATCFIITIFFSLQSIAQEQPLVDGQMAICTVKVGDKLYTRRPNQIGCFPKIAKIPPGDTVAIEVSYPNGRAGEKIVLSVEDGGKLDNGKGVKVMQLDNQKKCSFNFTVTQYPGLYRVSLLKNMDTKVVQLWVD